MPHDHRFNRVSLLRSSWAMFWRSFRRGERGQRWKRIDNSLSRAAPTRNLWLFGSLIGGYLTGWGALVALHISAGLPMEGAMILAVVGTGSSCHAATCVLFPMRYRKGKPFIACCLAEHICPVCEYVLQDLRPQSDGCVQCPECGSHWRLTRAP